VDIEKLRRSQRQANIRFRILGVLMWLALIVAGINVLIGGSRSAIVVGVILIVIGAGMLALRVYVMTATRRARRSAEASERIV